MRIRCAFWLLIAIGCGGVSSASDARVSPSIDAPRMCDPTAKFGTPIPVPGLSTIDGGTVRLSADELTIYFSATPGDLWVAHRSALSEAFEVPTPMIAQNSSSVDIDPAVTPDGLTLWFASNRIVNEGYHLYVATRASMLAEFGTPGLAGTVNAMDTKQIDLQPFVTADGKELWFTSTRLGGLGGNDIWRATWTGSAFAPPVPVPELSSSSDDHLPTLSADRLTVYVTSLRVGAGTKGKLDIWTSHRSTVNDGFPPPTIVDELNTAGDDLASWLSADNCRIYGASNLSGPNRLYVATRQP
jgi:WD40-like Beta Propeller Repeat